jgi:hypothetical protein
MPEVGLAPNAPVKTAAVFCAGNSEGALPTKMGRRKQFIDIGS